ncbi:MAG: hypothetical protein HW418_3853 [Anaerolineales bacterium]|nr:hypothetical protein [Anaerolineales bacterium]
MLNASVPAPKSINSAPSERKGQASSTAVNSMVDQLRPITRPSHTTPRIQVVVAVKASTLPKNSPVRLTGWASTRSSVPFSSSLASKPLPVSTAKIPRTMGM